MSPSYGPYKQVILFGDSMTQTCDPERGFSFHGQLAYYYQRKLDVINRGFSGYNTTQARKVLGPGVVPPPEIADVALMIVFFGANDACLYYPQDKYCQHVPLKDYQENLREILKYPGLVKQTTERILIAPPPIHELMAEDLDRGNGKTENQRAASETNKYGEAAKKVGAELGVPVIDLKLAFENACDWPKGGPLIGSRDAVKNENLKVENEKFSEFFSDGLHLSPAGNRIVYDEIIKVIETKLKDLSEANLKEVFPLWRDDIWHE